MALLRILGLRLPANPVAASAPAKKKVRFEAVPRAGAAAALVREEIATDESADDETTGAAVE